MWAKVGGMKGAVQLFVMFTYFLELNEKINTTYAWTLNM